MRLRCVALALLVSSLASIEDSTVTAQDALPLGPEPLVNPADPAPIPTPEAAPNPFRTLELPQTQNGPPGYAEATDQDLFTPTPTNPTPLNLSPGNQGLTPTPVSTSSNSTRNSNPFSPRLARAAPIMGDSIPPSLEFTYFDTLFDEHGYVTQIPAGGGATRRKIAENTAAFPVDRLIFNYNNFQGAVESFDRTTNVDRYTIGIEKTFLSSLFSLDVRFPLPGNNDVNTPGTFTRNGSQVGNLSVALKALLTSDDDSAIVAGLVVDTPTGGGTRVSLFDDTFITYNNDAVHLAPFLGFLCLQDRSTTHQGFIQVDVATNANGFRYSDTSGNPAVDTEFQEQTLLYLDYSVSKAVYEGDRGSILDRLTAIAEFHYTTTLEDTDVITIDNGFNNFDFTSAGGRIDVLNFTAGFDTALSNGAHIRFGTVVPLTDGNDRFFDIEFQAQLNVPL